jgi:hypothetical protein
MPTAAVSIPLHRHRCPRPFTRHDHIKQLTNEAEGVDLIVIFPCWKAEQFGTKLFGPGLILPAVAP